MATKDPHRYFRIEARDLLAQMGQAMLELEQGTEVQRPGVLARLLRLAHTLKGAASVVRQPLIATHAHEIEDILAPLRDSGAAATRAQIDALLALSDQVAQGVAALEPAPFTPPATVLPAEPAMAEIPQLAPEELDALLASIDQVQAHLPALQRGLQLTRQAAAAVSAGRSEGLALQLAGLECLLDASLHQLGRELLSVRDGAEQLRLLPAAQLFMPLQRAARDAARVQDKQLSFTGRGGEVRMEAAVLNAVQGALVQMVRNAVAHGIETPATRLAAGKLAQGRIELTVERRGREVIFCCSDDGAGVNGVAVRAAAQAKGLAGVAALDEPALLALLLRGGLSTARQVDGLAGRGVGLDLIRDTAERLGGRLDLQTEAGQGTRLSLIVPLQVAALRTLTVGAAGLQAYVPLDAVEQVLRAPVLAGAQLLLGDVLLPYAPLARALRPSAPAGEPGCALIIRCGSERAALGVDALLGVGSIVLRRPPALLPDSALVSGVAFDAGQRPQLVLDPAGLIAFAATARPAPQAPAATPALVLVIDDSLTTRMLEQSILESAGYRVHMASSAEDGLEAARRQRYALFLVDVEMPGMDGFEFIARTRADPQLREVPAILVSSRNAPEDKRRGREVGASGYIVKSEFAQDEFLQQVRQLVLQGAGAPA